jgi:hypothetical protein
MLCLQIRKNTCSKIARRKKNSILPLIGQSYLWKILTVYASVNRLLGKLSDKTLGARMEIQMSVLFPLHYINYIIPGHFTKHCHHNLAITIPGTSMACQ